MDRETHDEQVDVDEFLESTLASVDRAEELVVGGQEVWGGNLGQFLQWRGRGTFCTAFSQSNILGQTEHGLTASLS